MHLQADSQYSSISVTCYDKSLPTASGKSNAIAAVMLLTLPFLYCSSRYWINIIKLLSQGVISRLRLNRKVNDHIDSLEFQNITELIS